MLCLYSVNNTKQKETAMHTNESLALRNLLPKLISDMESLIDEKAMSMVVRTAHESATKSAKIAGMEEMLQMIKDNLTKKITLIENQAETDLEESNKESVRRHKHYSGRELFQELTNKRKSTVMNMVFLDIELALDGLGYVWNDEKNFWDNK